MNKELHSILKSMIGNGIADKIYIAETIRKDGKDIVVYSTGKEYAHIGADDSKCRYGYIRQTSEVDLKPIQFGGCGNVYSRLYNYRLVIFDKHFEGNKDFFTRLFLGGLRSKMINIKKIWEQSRTLFNSENAFNREVELMPNNLFIAVDFTFELKPGCCPETIDLCELPNNIICL